MSNISDLSRLAQGSMSPMRMLNITSGRNIQPTEDQIKEVENRIENLLKDEQIKTRIKEIMDSLNTITDIGSAIRMLNVQSGRIDIDKLHEKLKSTADNFKNNNITSEIVSEEAKIMIEEIGENTAAITAIRMLNSQSGRVNKEIDKAIKSVVDDF